MQTECHSFADPYVEHDSLTLILDLILLKRGVYRHLLYNRGIEPRRLGPGTGSAGSASSSQEAYSSNKKNKQREKVSQLSSLNMITEPEHELDEVVACSTSWRSSCRG